MLNKCLINSNKQKTQRLNNGPMDQCFWDPVDGHFHEMPPFLVLLTFSAVKNYHPKKYIIWIEHSPAKFCTQNQTQILFLLPS